MQEGSEPGLDPENHCVHPTHTRIKFFEGHGSQCFDRWGCVLPSDLRLQKSGAAVLVCPALYSSLSDASDTYNSSNFSSSSFTAATSGADLTGGSGTAATTYYDSGTVSLTINGTAETASYAGGDTPFSVASKLPSTFSSYTAVTVNLFRGGAAGCRNYDRLQHRSQLLFLRRL